ncbi:TSC22 domain family protein 4 [Thalassophryne amazonica]|uniref:TSC22 domain family protein 4 n=1 Tax=Thalassophryne amazonica TaxID=390379 RepID=UPI00147135DC|nr:TSC22 domain family protein 4 [Thalassophryne amazonica]
MSSGSGKRRSGFQITSVTSDLHQHTAGQSAGSVVLTVLQSPPTPTSTQGSSSQPTTPSLKRKNTSHDALGHSSRFRVVRLAVGGASRGEHGGSYRRGRWTCTDVMEWHKGAGFRRVMDSMRHAHSLESLEMIGLGREEGRVHSSHVHSQDTSHLLAPSQPIRGREGAGLKARRGPPSPVHLKPISIQLLDHKKSIRVQDSGSTPLLHSPHPCKTAPPPLRLDDGAAERTGLRLSPSQPSSPPAGSFCHTPAAFSLDQTIFNLPGHDGYFLNFSYQLCLHYFVVMMTYC